MQKFVVKLHGENDAQFVLSLAFEKGWKWFDDDRNGRNLKSGQKIKNAHAGYLYFGYKGEGLISWSDKINRSVPPAHILNARSSLSRVITLLEGNDALHVNSDPLMFNDGVVECACKKFKADFVADVLSIANQVKENPRGITFHSNGDISFMDRRISYYLLNKISERLG